jgi:3-isopropylmalate/(R)-2-methylmalate dehydratase small subunit
LNQPAVAGASVLLARRNFGCGSSREHAVWALADYGIKVVIAPSFADIFYNNCFKNSLLAIKLSEDTVEQLFQLAAKHPGYKLSIDLQQQTVTDEHGLKLSFEVDESRRQNMLQGLDDIALTLLQEDKIAAFEARRSA